MLLEAIDAAIGSICKADSRLDLLEAMKTGSASLGFQSFNLSCNKAHSREFMTDATLSSFSADDLNAYHRGDWANRDPLLERAAQKEVREVWQPQDWLADSDTREYAEYIAGTGIRSGVTAALIGRPGTLSAITALSFTTPHLNNKAAHAMSILGQAALTKASVLGLPSIDIPATSEMFVTLTDRQTVIMKWVSQGKSNGDIAEIMGLSKRAVAYHISEILKKLGVASRAQAAVLFSGR